MTTDGTYMSGVAHGRATWLINSRSKRNGSNEIGCNVQVKSGGSGKDGGGEQGMTYHSRDLTALINQLRERIRRSRAQSSAILAWPEEIEQIIDALEAAQREVASLKSRLLVITEDKGQ